MAFFIFIFNYNSDENLIQESNYFACSLAILICHLTMAQHIHHNGSSMGNEAVMSSLAASAPALLLKCSPLQLSIPGQRFYLFVCLFVSSAKEVATNFLNLSNTTQSKIKCKILQVHV